MKENMGDEKLRDHHQNENRNNLIQGYSRQEKIFGKIKKILPIGSRILEIGFGDGYLLNKLSKFGYKVYGQDLSEKNIELTKKQWNTNDVCFLLGDDSGKLLVQDSSLDGFVASEVLEHMSDSELLFCIQEIYRVLKKGGYVFLTFPVKEDMQANECICPKCGEVFHKRGHKQYRDENKIKKTFGRFQIIKNEEFFSRYVGKSFLDNLIGYIMLIIRCVLSKVISLDNKTYFLILKKL